jgi:hypothetical protein
MRSEELSAAGESAPATAGAEHRTTVSAHHESGSTHP